MVHKPPISGNYELWDGDEKLLPGGTTWLRMPKVGDIAGKLKVDFAQALVGFSRSAGHAQRPGLNCACSMFYQKAMPNFCAASFHEAMYKVPHNH